MNENHSDNQIGRARIQVSPEFGIFDLRLNTVSTRKITFIDNHEEFNKR